MAKSDFEKLFELDVSSKTEKKKNGKVELTYLSWAWAWAEFVKVHPDATYEIIKNTNGLPYFADESGAMVYTKVTVGNLTHEMWLPVMDGANNAMKAFPYTYNVKEYNYGKWTGGYTEKTVNEYTMFDINKTIMRCLVKNLAMFGLGLYIYAGEDLPVIDVDKAPSMPPPSKASEEDHKAIMNEFKGICEQYSVSPRAFLIADGIDMEDSNAVYKRSREYLKMYQGDESLRNHFIAALEGFSE